MNSDLPLVSVITGYYNRKENLFESVSSVLNQDYPNFEYIIFDDCSDDGTFQLLEQFEKNSKLLLYRNEENLGLTKGLIQAISKSKGKYIAIHGAGDISLPKRLSKQVELLEKDPGIGIVGCLLEDIFDGKSHLHSPQGKKGLSYFTHGEVMYRRNLYFKTGGYNPFLKYGQFSLLKFEMLKHSKAGFVNEILYKRIHYSNGVTRNKKKKLEQILNINFGALASMHGFWNIDTSSLVISLTFQNIELLVNGSPDESRLIRHLNGKLFYKFIYYLYRMGIFPKIILSKVGSYIRRKKGLTL
jgi:glycosyltransferase involved in cell wall biosynthesis